MTRYHKLYRTEVHDPETETLERMLNRVARQGWEFVGVMPPIATMDGDGGHWLPEVIFKRALAVATRAGDDTEDGHDHIA